MSPSSCLPKLSVHGDSLEANDHNVLSVPSQDVSLRLGPRCVPSHIHSFNQYYSVDPFLAMPLGPLHCLPFHCYLLNDG